MHLAPREVDKLVIHQLGFISQKRLARGLRLSHPEAVALIAMQVLEFIRDGKSVSECMNLGKQLLGKRQVLPGVKQLIDEVQVEGTFPDGTKLVTVHDPICNLDGDLNLALYGSFLPVPALEKFQCDENEIEQASVITAPGDIVLNSHHNGNDGHSIALSVTNLGDRPIQIGSHYHFIEANSKLQFDRQKAYGMRLNIPSGTAIRFEPGDSKTVKLVKIGGKQVIRGGNNLCDGPVDHTTALPLVMQRITHLGFAHKEQPGDSSAEASVISREHYAAMYGPTTGDKVRLGDSNLFLQVEKDFTIYGEECKFGGGKVIREGMGQATTHPDDDTLDCVITNALIVDYTGIYKADIGIKEGCIRAIGKAGNPDVMDGVDPLLVVGVRTEVIAGEGSIVTAGGIDTHIHFICPQQCNEALASGVTTMIGGGTGPATGTNATTCTPGPYNLRLMYQATDAIPINIGLTGKGNTSKPEALREQILAGAIGLKLHEDWGTSPAAIDNCLTVADEMGIQVTIHTDTLNESGFVEDTIRAFKGRTIHTYHSEGAGGGHAPDIIRVCGEKNVLPSSTNPTRPFTVNTIDEHMDMLMVCHHLDKNIPEDVSFADSRIRGETIAAEDILHDIGAISMMSSDSQAMGRVGEVITRTWQTAAKMKEQRGPLPEETGDNDNFRIKRYVAKYTINPAIAHGIDHLVGSVEVGKVADLVLWKPAFFGAKPELIIKSGMIVYSQMGDANASIPTPEPVIMRPMFGALGKAASSLAIAFVSRVSTEQGRVQSYGLQKRVEAIRGCRHVTKLDMKLNDKLPKIEVDPETFKVTADGVFLTCSPATKLPLAQAYFSS